MSGGELAPLPQPLHFAVERVDGAVEPRGRARGRRTPAPLLGVGEGGRTARIKELARQARGASCRSSTALGAGHGPGLVTDAVRISLDSGTSRPPASQTTIARLRRSFSPTRHLANNTVAPTHVSSVGVAGESAAMSVWFGLHAFACRGWLGVGGVCKRGRGCPKYACWPVLWSLAGAGIDWGVAKLVRHWVLIPACAGSSPATPATAPGRQGRRFPRGFARPYS